MRCFIMNEENKVVDTEVIEDENVNEKNPNVSVTFNLANNREVTINVNIDAVIQNVESLQSDINRLLGLLQSVISVDDENRTQVQNDAINAASSYLTNVNVPLTDYFHMSVDDYRLATVMVMDAIIACNTLIYTAQQNKQKTIEEADDE